MACPITITKFVGTISLGLSTGLSYSTVNVTIPSLRLLPTASHASRSLNEVKRLTCKHALGLSNIANACILFAYCFSPAHRKHPYLIWMSVTSTLGSYGVDYWSNRGLGLKGWVAKVIKDSRNCYHQSKDSSKKDEDLVVVDAEEKVNGEGIERDMDQERLLQKVRMWFSGVALAMGIVGLWGDRF